MAARSLLALAALASAALASPSSLSAPFPDSLYDIIAAAANATLVQVPTVTQYPTNGISGRYGWQTSSSNGWTSGFFPGLLLQLYNRSSALGRPDAPWWLSNGVARASGLASEQYDTSTHDVGFIVYTSLGALYGLTGNTTARDITLRTAQSLATRFVPTVGAFRSWGSPNAEHTCETIADNMMNLELLWWAGQESGNTTYWTMASSHSNTMIRDLFQSAPANPEPVPGSVWHLITYNDTDGSIISRSSTPQGLGLNTVWSRGQSWVVNGFAIAYRFTQTPAFLAAAQDAADAFIGLTTACCGNAQYNWAPLWDFNVTAPQISVDTSAAMIATSGILEIARFTADTDRRAAYMAYAKQTLDAVLAAYSFVPTTANDAVLNNGTVTYPAAGISIIYADYYLLQACMRWDAMPAEWREEAAAVLAARQ
jgi:unsaturated chondroitin disaccharide hydrolase